MSAARPALPVYNRSQQNFIITEHLLRQRLLVLVTGQFLLSARHFRQNTDPILKHNHGGEGSVLVCRRRGDESSEHALLTSCPTAKLGHCRGEATLDGMARQR